MSTPHVAPAGTNLVGLRDHNAALVLGLLRGRPEGGSRVELAAETGLTPQAVGKIVTRLLTDGTVEEAGQAASTGGKPRTLLRLRPDAGCAVGVHLDRDELTVLLVDLAGRPRYRRTVPVDTARGPAPTVELIADQVRAAATEAPPGARLLGVGAGCRGPLDHGSGVLHWFSTFSSPHDPGTPGWDRFPLRDALAARLAGLPVVVDKDTNAAALTEAPGAAAAPGSGVAYIHLAGGLGAGLLLDGVVHRGARTNAGEFGHQTLLVDGPLCDCGNRGCLEALCLAELRRADHAAAARLVGVGVANLVRVLDVDRVVLGGRVILERPETYRAGVAEQLRERIPDARWQPVAVSVSTAGPWAVAAGAAELVLGPVFGRRA
ncbi:ROK family protein [Kitasatospora sp. NPDC057015]|uniref:ROK family protein n=1 Tax=Kitasatospora sp. NPDC057015 TaxID=3346001 RepID=UPI00362F5244